MPWNYAAEGLHRLKDKFQEWDKGEGKRREESNSQEENFCQQESFQDEQEEIREKENHKKCRQSTSDSLLIRGFKAIGRGCRWCIYAAMAFMMLTIAFMISMGLVGFAAMVLGGLATAIVFVVIGVLIGLAGIVASGFGFAFFNFWTGIAVLSGSVALLGFCALLELFLLKMLKIFWSFSKNVFAKSAELWMRMLRKIESWLIVKKEKTAEKSTINKSEKTVSQKENSVSMLPLPMDDAEQQDSKEDSLDGGKEVL